MAELPVKQKQAFILRCYQYLPLKETAELLGVKAGTVKAYLFKALRNLRQQLTNYISV